MPDTLGLGVCQEQTDNISHQSLNPQANILFGLVGQQTKQKIK